MMRGFYPAVRLSSSLLQLVQVRNSWLYDLKQKRYLVYNSQRANTSIIPVSTFKIFNSQVALETGVIKDENEVIKWDGTPQKFPEWNKDQTMRSAIAGSVIWFYQDSPLVNTSRLGCITLGDPP
jgi:beta-lactamase class D